MRINPETTKFDINTTKIYDIITVEMVLLKPEDFIYAQREDGDTFFIAFLSNIFVKGYYAGNTANKKNPHPFATDRKVIPLDLSALKSNADDILVENSEHEQFFKIEKGSALHAHIAGLNELPFAGAIADKHTSNCNNASFKKDKVLLLRLSKNFDKITDRDLIYAIKMPDGKYLMDNLPENVTNPCLFAAEPIPIIKLSRMVTPLDYNEIKDKLTQHNENKFTVDTGCELYEHIKKESCISLMSAKEDKLLSNNPIPYLLSFLLSLLFVIGACYTARFGYTLFFAGDHFSTGNLSKSFSESILPLTPPSPPKPTLWPEPSPLTPTLLPATPPTGTPRAYIAPAPPPSTTMHPSPSPATQIQTEGRPNRAPDHIIHTDKNGIISIFAVSPDKNGITIFEVSPYGPARQE
jgi:hypothetical protein